MNQDQHLSFSIGTKVRVKEPTEEQHEVARVQAAGFGADENVLKRVVHSPMLPVGTEGFIEDVGFIQGRIHYQFQGCAWWDHSELEFLEYPTKKSLEVVAQAQADDEEDEFDDGNKNEDEFDEDEDDEDDRGHI